MEVLLKDVLNSEHALLELEKLHIKGKDLHNAGKLSKWVRAEIESFNETRNKICTTAGGILKDNIYSFPKNNGDSVSAEIKDIFESTVVNNLNKLSFDGLEQAGASVGLISGLLWAITEPGPEATVV